MLQDITAVLIWSENFRALANWYIEKLDFKPIEELNHPNDTGVGFMVGHMYFWVGQHSKVHGKNPDPCRHMINIKVGSVTETYNHLKSKGIEFIAEPFKAPTFDKYFATFKDLDGNYLQLIGNK